MILGSRRMKGNGIFNLPCVYTIILLFSLFWSLIDDKFLTLWFSLCRYIALLVISVVCYIATYAFSGVLFMWFNPSGHDCGLNVFFIVMTMILAFVFAIVALHPVVNGSLLPASVISVYCAYICYTGLSSEPHDYVCNGLNRSKAVTASTLTLGMLTTVLSVLYSALRAGSSTTFLSPPSSPRAGTSSNSSIRLGISFFCFAWNVVSRWEGGIVRRPWGWEEERWSRGTACELLILFLPYNLCACEHVRGNASLRMDWLFRECLSDRRGMDLGLGQDLHRLGHGCTLHLDTHRTAHPSGSWVLLNCNIGQ